MIPYRKLKQLYNHIGLSGTDCIQKRNEYLDNHLNYISTDKRFGLSLVIPTNHEINQAVSNILHELWTIEPYQYYYPISDIHLTVLTVVKMEENFFPERGLIEEYLEVFNRVFQDFPSFKVYFKGITISNGAVIMNGYYDHYLVELRKCLQNELSRKNLPFEVRHDIKTAHSTIVRFNTPLRHRNNFVGKVQSMSDKFIGIMDIEQVDFVYHNWYNTLHQKLLVDSYHLKRKK